MAKVDGVSGAHARENIGLTGDSVSGENAQRAAKFGGTPAKETFETIVYADGKKKILSRREYRNAKGELLSVKSRVACILKDGKVLSGKKPEGMK